MHTTRLEFVLRAEQPIAHAEETLGNSSLLMRRKVRQPDGSWSRVPIITADTMRHGLREAAAYAYLDAAGLLGESLTEAALRLLFAGGMVTGSAGGSIRLGDYREMCELFPPLALLGGCAQNRVIPGRVMVDDALLVCAEHKHLLPPWVLDEISVLDPARQHVEEVQRVRMDPTLDPAKRTLLTSDERLGVEMRLGVSEQAATDGDARTADATRSSMLPRRVECVARGSLLSWSVTATTYSDLERDTFMIMVSSFLHDARVGGKRATGHGLLRAIAAQHCTPPRPSDRIEMIDVTDIGARYGALFRAHVAERRERVAEFLRRVAA